MLVWIGFGILVVFILALDLGVLNRTSHIPTFKEALSWTAMYVTFALAFSGFVYFGYENAWLGLGDTIGRPADGKTAFLEYLTGYVVEQSLSIDNIFVIAVIFSYFKIPTEYQHRVLFWGILGAVVFRALMIFVGVVLIERFSWMSYVFGAILIYSAYKMYTSTDEEVDPDKNPVVNFFKKFMPVTSRFDGEKFFIKRLGVTAATPLFIALLVVETTDVMFAFDSIPAIFAITTDPFLVFTSNIFAILGLRSLYFVLASVLDKFRFLQLGLTLILAFVGVKMILIAQDIHIPEVISLGVIILTLAGSILASMYLPAPETEPEVMHDLPNPTDIENPSRVSPPLRDEKSPEEIGRG